jgi:ATP-dependent DNA helicase DinG
VAQQGAALRALWDGTVLVQGEAPPARLLDAFRAGARAVLVGAASFWQGVDVPGPALSCVIVDRLPFAAPGDPVLAARIAHLRASGRDPFAEYQLPHAVLTLRQGLGRLLRGPQDRGVLVVCDPRLTTRGYGRVFLASLPAMPRTRDVAAVHAFFAAGARGAAA